MKIAAGIVVLIGLLLEMRGAYLAASMFQPFRFREFLRHIPRILSSSTFGFRPGLVLSPSYGPAAKIKRKFIEEEGRDAPYFIAGLGLMVVGIGLQFFAGIVVLWFDFRGP